jgi:hypothetical protein
MRGRDFMKRGLKDWAFNEGIDKGPDLIAEKIAKYDFEKFSPASRSENQGVKEKKEKSLADRQHTTKPEAIESITRGSVASHQISAMNITARNLLAMGLGGWGKYRRFEVSGSQRNYN